MGQNVVKINMQIYDVYNVNDVPMDVASWHNSQLSQPFMEALHQTLYLTKKSRASDGRSECPKVSRPASNQLSQLWYFSTMHSAFLNDPCFLATLFPRTTKLSPLKNHISPTSKSTDLAFQVQLGLPTLTHLVTITPVSCVLCDMRQVYNCWIHVSRELIKTSKPINSLRNM